MTINPTRTITDAGAGVKSARPLRRYLQALHPELSEGAHIEVRTFKSGQPGPRRFCSTHDEAEQFILEKRTHTDVFCAVATRKKGDGSKQGIVRCQAVFCDLDFKAFPGGEAEARQWLASFPLKPSMVIFTGHGLHVYWLLVDAVTLEDLHRVERVIKGLVRALGGDVGATDLSRILRPPETFNRKNGAAIPVVLETFTDARYTLADFDRYILPNCERSSTTRTTSTVGVSLDDDQLLARIRRSANGERFSALFDRGDTSAYGGDHSRADQALLNDLAWWTGGDRDRMDRLYRQSGLMRDKWDQVHYADGRTYGQGTIDKAIQDATTFYSGTSKECLPEGVKVDKNQVQPTPAPNNENVGDNLVVSGSFHLTDMGNAERLIARHGNDLRYCGAFGKWLCWDGQRWKPDQDGEVERRMKATVRGIYEEAMQEADSGSRKEILKHALRSEGEQRIRSAIALARSEELAPVSADALDVDPMLLCCPNGVVDLRTGLLLPHRRGDLITKITGTAYNPDAQCPRFLGFLTRIFENNEALLTFVQRAIGYSLTAYTVERVIFILHGLGANGKSTLLETLGAALGDYALHTPTDTLMVKKTGTIPNDLARLKGARFVSATESEEGKRLAESLIKSLSGNDTINARFLHQEWFQFVPQCKIWLGTNHKPVIRGGDQAIWDRIRLIPFNVRIPPPEDPEHPKEGEQDKFFGDKLRAELPGILAWAVRGCLDWQRKGLTMPPEVRKATESYRAEMDVLTGFLADCCIVGERVTTVSAKTLHQAYKNWCEANGEDPQPQRTVGIQLRERGFTNKRGAGGAYEWRGIRLKTLEEQTSSEVSE